MSNNKQQTAVEWLDNQVDIELKVINNLYGKEIMGRKIALSFVKRILIEAKRIENQQIENAYAEGYNRVVKLIEDATQRNL